MHKLSVEDAVLRARMLQLDKHVALAQTEFHDSVLLDKVRLPGGQRLPARGTSAALSGSNLRGI